MSRWKMAVAIIVLVIVAVLTWRLWPRSAPSMGARSAADAPVPVTVVPVVEQDVPVYLSALGTVQALNTVTVRPQVGGQLMSLEFKEGAEVKKGDVIAHIDPRTYQAQLAQAVAKKKQDDAQLASAQSTLARYEDLITKHFVAAQDLENQRNTVHQLAATVAADAAAIQASQVQVDYTRVLAPIDGLAGIRLVDPGNVMTANDATGIVVLTQIHPINILFTLPEQNLGLVRSTDNAHALSVTAMDRVDSHVIAADGVVSVIDNQIDASTGTFRVKSEFQNQKSALWPGQFVNVRLRVNTVHNGLVVPAQAIQRGPDGDYVYLVQADDTVKMQPVKVTGEAEDNRMLVGSGVAAGDRVVTEGQFRLKPGLKVQPLAPGEVPAAPSAEEISKAAKGGSGGRGGRR